MFARDVMTRKFATIGPDGTVKHAAQLMIRHRVSGLPVVNDEGELEGIVTEGDLIQRVGALRSEHGIGNQDDALKEFIKTNSWRVSDVMTRPVICVEEDDSLASVALLLRNHRIKRIVVTRVDRVVGVISRRDLIKTILAAKPEHVAAGDAALRRSAIARLGFDAELNTQNIKVTVLNRAVLLEGEVNSPAAREAARVAIETIEGVAGVDNQLRVTELRAASR